MTQEEKRDLVVKLAEGVMEWRGCVMEPYFCYQILPGIYKQWHPTESISDAWMLVEAMTAKDWQPTLIVRQFEKHPEDRFGCHGCRLVTEEIHGATSQRIQSFSAKAQTMPLAICLAAAKSLEVEHG